MTTTSVYGPPSELAAYLAWRQRSGPAYAPAHPKARFNDLIDRLNIASWFYDVTLSPKVWQVAKLEFERALAELREKRYPAP